MPQRNKNVTEAEGEVFSYIVEFVKQYGYQPSCTEIAAHFGVTRAAISQRIKRLASKGFVELPGVYQDRCLRLKNVRFEAIFTEEDLS